MSIDTALLGRTLSEHRDALAKGDYSSEELVTAYLAHIKENDPDLRAYLTVLYEEAPAAARAVDRKRRAGEHLSPLAGIPFAAKDNICTRGIPTTCGSRLLEHYRPPYDATVIEQLTRGGAILLGKTNMDEFAMGSTTEHSAFGPTANPICPGLVPGGSSGGSAAAVASGEAPWALGSDTGGSVRQPAAFCGLVGICPTYGAVSRYGLVAYASSFDRIGALTGTVADSAAVLSALVAHDPRDGTSRPHPDPNFDVACDKPLGTLTVGIVREAFGAEIDDEVRTVIDRAVASYKLPGLTFKQVSLPALSYAVAAYCVMSSAEASSNLGRFDGIRYGRRAEGAADTEELIRAGRSEGFGTEVKRRILLGTYVLSGGYYEQYYRRAKEARAMLSAEVKEALASCDLLLLPATPTPPYPMGEKTDQAALRFAEDLCSLPASLCGLPALTLPCGKTQDGRPVSLQLVARPFGENTLYRLASKLS